MAEARELAASVHGQRDDEEQVRARQAEFEVLVEGLHSGVALIDAGGQFTLYNRRFLQMFGLSPDAGIENVNSQNWSAWQVLDQDGRVLDVDEHPVRKAALTRQPVRERLVAVRLPAGGDLHWMLVSAEPMLTTAGSIAQIICTYHDVTDRRRAEDELREAQHRMRSVAEHLPSGLIVADLSTRALQWNREALAIHGYREDDGELPVLERLVAEHDLRTLAGEPIPVESWPLPRLLSGESFRDYELLVRNVRLGWERIFSYSGVVVPGLQPPTGLLVIQDVTDRKRAEERAANREAQLKLAMDASLAIVFEWDIVRDRVTRAQSAEEALPTDGERGRTLDAVASVVHPADRGLFRANVDAALHAPDGRYTSEFRIIRPDGEERWLGESGRVHFDDRGRPVRLIGISMDVTERKRSEEDLRAANERLREEDRRKSEFLAVLSHELRNPLAPIRNGMAILERAPAGSEQASRAREVVRRQTEHLTRLVDDLLDVTRISRGKVTLQRVRLDLRDVVRSTTDDLGSVFAHAGLVLHVDHVVGPVWVDADATRIAQVLGNLLHNSAKFTPRGGLVSVMLMATGSHAELTVRDSGIGIQPEMLERVFEPFTQGEQTLARSSGGLGLGLALVKGLVELHGGTVEARSAGSGRGAEFVIRLPRSGGDREAATDQDFARAGNGPNQVILIIEDSTDAGQSLADLLELSGHRVRVVPDGRSGIALAHELRPDVVLCDIGLPDLDGYQVARELRRDDSLAGTRLIALTGYAQPEDRQRARDAGFDAHIAKPPDIDELMKVLESGRRHQRG